MHPFKEDGEFPEMEGSVELKSLVEDLRYDLTRALAVDPDLISHGPPHAVGFTDREIGAPTYNGWDCVVGDLQDAWLLGKELCVYYEFPVDPSFEDWLWSPVVLLQGTPGLPSAAMRMMEQELAERADQVRDHLQKEVQKWLQEPNYIGILPAGVRVELRPLVLNQLKKRGPA